MDKLKTLNLPFNHSGRDFVIGDLHGMYDLLIEKLHEVSFDKYNDRLFSVGDLVDRGPKSFECLKLIKKPWFYSVLANHEELMVKSLIGHDRGYFHCWVMNGGDWYDSVPLVELMEYVRCASELPYSIKVGEGGASYGFLHADAPPTWDDVTDVKYQNSMLWGRLRIEHMNESIVEGIGQVYCGHTPRKDVLRLGNVNFIDTGACFPKGKLTMIKLN